MVHIKRAYWCPVVSMERIRVNGHDLCPFRRGESEMFEVGNGNTNVLVKGTKQDHPRSKKTCVGSFSQTSSPDFCLSALVLFLAVVRHHVGGNTTIKRRSGWMGVEYIYILFLYYLYLLKFLSFKILFNPLFISLVEATLDFIILLLFSNHFINDYH